MSNISPEKNSGLTPPNSVQRKLQARIAAALMLAATGFNLPSSIHSSVDNQPYLSLKPVCGSADDPNDRRPGVDISFVDNQAGRIIVVGVSNLGRDDQGISIGDRRTVYPIFLNPLGSVATFTGIARNPVRDGIDGRHLYFTPEDRFEISVYQARRLHEEDQLRSLEELTTGVPIAVSSVNFPDCGPGRQQIVFA